MKKILILNTGGTFNKVYNELSGNLDVPLNNSAVKQIIDTAFKDNLALKIEGIIYKDSLEMNDKDRQLIVHALKDYEKVILIHGTDTMDITAKYLCQHLSNKTVVITGAMKPFSIEPIEATANLCISLQFLLDNDKSGVYIGMHGLVNRYEELVKNREIGKFELNKKVKN